MTENDVHPYVQLLDRITVAALAGDGSDLFNIYTEGAVLWHNLKGTRISTGEPIALHACAVIQVNDEGRITRLDEYFDSAEAMKLAP